MNRFLLFALATATLPLSTLGSPRVAMAQEATAPVVKSPSIEVEVTYFSVDPATFKELGLVAESREGDSGPFTRGKLPLNGAYPVDPQFLVGKLLADQKALLLKSPRVLLGSNKQADVYSEMSGFANIGYDKGMPGPASVLNTMTRGVVSPTPEMVKENSALAFYVGKLQLKTSQGFTTTPTLNPDRTVNLKISPGMTVELFYEKPSTTDKNKLEKVTVMKSNMVEEQTLVNLKDGQTVLLVPKDPATLNGLLGPYSSDNPRYIMLAVKALLIKSQA